jgi:hypothetical protein
MYSINYKRGSLDQGRMSVSTVLILVGPTPVRGAAGNVETKQASRVIAQSYQQPRHGRGKTQDLCPNLKSMALVATTLFDLR